MSLSKSRFAYTDCYEVLDRAMDDPSGIRVRIRDYDAALIFRSRLHYARKLKREDSERLYEPDDPKFGVTIYDTLVVRIKNVSDQFFIYIEHRQTPTDIQSLAEVEDHERLDGAHMDRRHLVDDLAQSVVVGTGPERVDGEAPSTDERPVQLPKITRRL